MFKSASSLNIKDEDRNSSLNNNNNNKRIRKNFSPKLKLLSINGSKKQFQMNDILKNFIPKKKNNLNNKNNINYIINTFNLTSKNDIKNESNPNINSFEDFEKKLKKLKVENEKLNKIILEKNEKIKFLEIENKKILMKNQTIQKALENEKNINKAIIADQEQLMNILYILEYKGINVEKIIAEFNENNYDNPNQYKKKIVKAEDDFDVSGSFHSSKFSDMTLSSFYLTEYNYKNIEKKK
jgi:hypothetical protein